MLRLHDTASGRVVELATREPGKVAMYVCGPTVYDLPHIGHGRFTLVFDVLRRYLEWRGFEVTYVSNVTDVDDKIVRRAADEGRRPEEVAAEYEAHWWRAMDALSVRRPDATPHATEYVPKMVEAVAELEGRGLAYQTPDGVYLDTSKVPDYGLLARQPLDSLRAGARVEVSEAKRSPLDFALWKLTKPGEVSWPSPWGPGRPGWHTECVVMSLDLLGEGFDIHGGGQDLAFPHHENERAQAVALGRQFARHWVHNGFVEVEGEKMSKSLGNYSSLLELVEQTDPRAYRLLVLSAHYRSPLEVNAATLAQAASSLERLDSLARRFPPTGGPRDQEALARFRRAMDDDLGTPAALAVVFDLVSQANQAEAAGEVDRARALASTVAEMCSALGVDLRTGEEQLGLEAAKLASERDAARARRDWARADELRSRLEAMGYLVEDTVQGTRIRRR